MDLRGLGKGDSRGRDSALAGRQCHGGRVSAQGERGVELVRHWRTYSNGKERYGGEEIVASLPLRGDCAPVMRLAQRKIWDLRFQIGKWKKKICFGSGGAALCAARQV